MNYSIAVIAHNIRSTHNIGSLLRTCDGLGINKVYLTGYTPYPRIKNDSRLPHISKKLTDQINKTALGAENSVNWEYIADIKLVLKKLKEEKYLIAGLEQHKDSIKLNNFKNDQNIAILLGSEVTGIEKDLYQHIDIFLEIPMFGEKESFNVVEAATMALYQTKFIA